MAWGTIMTDAAWAARMAAKIIRPAIFLYLDWPGLPLRVSTFHKPVTTTEDDLSPTEAATWTGVGNLGFVETAPFGRGGALVSFKVGITSLPQGSITESTEAAAIGRRAILYLGLFDEAWENPILQRTFVGHIISAGDFKHSRDKAGNWITEASVEISNGRSPRRQLGNHHSPEVAAAGDTAWRLLPTAGRTVTWPS